jgi:two-component system chemotaxis response regulator CheY
MKKNFKIMICDDSMFMRQVLKGILSGAGYTNFVEFGDGQDCLDNYEKEKPDLILLDIIMPNVTGLDVLKQIGKKVKIIIISAVGHEKIVEEEQVLKKVKKISG